MSTPFEVIPSAHRLIESLRDMGYDFAQAAADLVDNSVAAKATKVAIEVVFDGDDSCIQIADNGSGMNPDQLREAMRYGSKRAYHEEDLGKFGLGLKTASMSQAQRLVVASRWNPDRADIAAYTWDLEHIKQTDRWEILEVDRSDLPDGIVELLKDGPGTVVYWQRLDRILGFKHPYGEFARKRLSQMCRDLEIHLGMVFHRFLSGETKSRRIRMTVNGNDVIPWDPFCRGESKTTPLQAHSFEVEFEGTKGAVTMEPFVLPHQADFSSPEAFRAAAGPAGWNQQQGFYIYRSGRMIQSGGWSHLRKPDEHMKLARVAVRFSPQLDAAFKINVAKMRVQLPAQIRGEIESFILPLTKLARQLYDRRGRSGEGKGVTSGSVGDSSARSGGVGRKTVDERLTLDEWASRLRRAARSAERPIVERVLDRMTSH